MPDSDIVAMGTPEAADIERQRPRTWTAGDRQVSRWACYVFFALSLAYVPTMGAGFVASGGLSAPIRDP